MPTTVTPLAHEACIASSAVTPSRPRRSRRSSARRRPVAPVSPPTTLAKRAFHAGDDDDRVGGGDPVEVGEQAVHAGDADVGQAVGREAVGPQGEHALVDDGHVARCRR